ncbi:heterokaryon incompatibility protein-domain-containing protein [Bipolaris maydis]|nr:heterokaryon incompatibility protein-domain-containing protein [Bipolaris maydis]KAJ6268536.1 heterokaryon incompatibility protein-domain-containing protein [Bipolaris maydis]KAJ6278781.1 heterokaryon incompatibility protein-domain-containing protein [Bipolaris maydis]
MTTGTPLPAFKHDPLPEHKSHFRLLRIISGDFGQHVECKIFTWPIGEAPPYYAISYVWGDANETTDITVNGSRLEVRRNCEYALQQAFATKACKHVWVDAICIDQTAEEKNHQVGIMDQIYSGAKHVLACVGPHENNSEFLSEFIRRYRPLMRHIRSAVNSYSMYIPSFTFLHHKNIFLHCLLFMNGRTR